MLQARLSFLIRATYDFHPSLQNLHLWYRSEENCHLCSSLNLSLQHILSECKAALIKGCYRWCHDQVLSKFAEVLETRRLEANGAHSATSQQRIHFVGQGKVEITATSLQPDIVLCSTPVKTVIIVELTVPWEEGLEAAFERKKERYTALAAACSQAGWRALTFPVESAVGAT